MIIHQIMIRAQQFLITHPIWEMDIILEALKPVMESMHTKLLKMD